MGHDMLDELRQVDEWLWGEKGKFEKKIEIMETWTDDVMTKREKINEDKLKIWKKNWNNGNVNWWCDDEKRENKW